MHKQLIEKAHTVFENKGGDYFAIKSRFGDVIIGGSYSKDFVEQYAKLNVNVVVTQAKGVAEPVGKLSVRTPQEIRDDIVAKAKRDVKELKEYGGYYHVPFAASVKKICNAEFIVNSEKRTVVVLLSGRITKTIFAKGIAKCDPSDCFNSHIGRAISLRRALGLEVPTEYYSAPQPTEVRVGDVIKWPHLPWIYEVTSMESARTNLRGFNANGTRFAACGGNFERSKIIDDSRD